MYVNEGSVPLHDAANYKSYEVQSTSAFTKNGKVRMLPTIKDFYWTIGSDRFPHNNGLTNLTPSKLKKYLENTASKQHVDKYSVRWIGQDKAFISVDLGCGWLYGPTPEDIGGYRFEDGKTRYISLYHTIEPIQSASSV